MTLDKQVAGSNIPSKDARSTSIMTYKSTRINYNKKYLNSENIIVISAANVRTQYL